MKAKQIPRIDIHDRMELKNALPLRTPYVIYIDPSDTCNFRCKFCPSGNLELMKKTRGRGHGPMDFEKYKGIIDSLKEFPDPIRVIRLYKEGEPLVNPRFADMVRYAKQSPRVLRVDTTTNASLLTPEPGDYRCRTGPPEYFCGGCQCRAVPGFFRTQNGLPKVCGQHRFFL